MKRKRLLFAGMVIALIAGLLIPSVALATKPDAKPHATDVEIVKKVGVKGGPSPRGGGGRPGPLATTGILGEEVTGTRYAIIVGISDYAVDEYNLQYADDDAYALKELLEGVYYFDEDNIEMLVNEEATREAILGAITGLPPLTEDDEVVFSFSGHGARGRVADGDKEAIDEGIVPYECTPEAVIWDGELKEAFSEFATVRIVFIFDSCLAGGMTDLEGDDRIILMACTENGYSAEIGEAYGQPPPFINHGLLTFFLILGVDPELVGWEGLLPPGLADFCDHDGDEILGEPSDVTVEEAFDYARGCVVGLSRTTPILMQTPTISDSFGGDLLP